MDEAVRKDTDTAARILRELLDSFRPLLEKAQESEPNYVEMSALTAMLHSFYTRVENIFKRIACLAQYSQTTSERLPSMKGRTSR